MRGDEQISGADERAPRLQIRADPQHCSESNPVGRCAEFLECARYISLNTRPTSRTRFHLRGARHRRCSLLAPRCDRTECFVVEDLHAGSHAVENRLQDDVTDPRRRGEVARDMSFGSIGGNRNKATRRPSSVDVTRGLSGPVRVDYPTRAVNSGGRMNVDRRGFAKSLTGVTEAAPGPTLRRPDGSLTPW